MMKNEKRLFYSTSEDDDDLFDGDEKIGDAKLKNAESTKTLVDELSDKKDRNVETTEEKEGSKGVKVEAKSLIEELASKVGASRSNVALNGLSSSTEDINNLSKQSKSQNQKPVDPRYPAKFQSQTQPNLPPATNLAQQGLPQLGARNKKSIFDSGSSSDIDGDSKSGEKVRQVQLKSKREEAALQTAQPASTEKSGAKSKNLFDSDSDSDDLFSSAPKLVKPTLPKSELAKPASSVLEKPALVSSTQVMPSSSATPKTPRVHRRR